MKELCFQPGSAEKLWGKELEKPNKITQHDPALLYTQSLQRVDELVAAYSTESFHKQRLQQQELSAAYASELAIHDQSLQEKELSAAYATALPKELGRTALAMELASTALTLSSLQKTELGRLETFQQASSTRACHPQLVASASSPRASRSNFALWKQESSLA